MEEKPNPYEPPRIPEPPCPPRPCPPRPQKNVTGLILSAVAGAVGTFILTAPMGAIDGGGEWYATFGAIACAAAYWLRS